MTTFALNNLWRYLQGLSLTQEDRRWLAAKLQEPALPPYTTEEIHGMIEQSERDLAAGRYRDVDDLFGEWDEEVRCQRPYRNSSLLGCEARTRRPCP